MFVGRLLRLENVCDLIFHDPKIERTSFSSFKISLEKKQTKHFPFMFLLYRKWNYIPSGRHLQIHDIYQQKEKKSDFTYFVAAAADSSVKKAGYILQFGWKKNP